jgi:hypothetical protein
VASDFLKLVVLTNYFVKRGRPRLHLATASGIFEVGFDEVQIKHKSQELGIVDFALVLNANY